MTGAHGRAHDGGGFAHSVFVHGGGEEYVRGVLTFVEEGLRAGELVIVVVPSDRLDLLREHLGRDADRIELRDMSVIGRNPARLIPGFAELVRSRQGRRVWFVGELVWAGRSAEEIDEAILHEALSNIALAELPVRGLCPYDAERLDPRVIAAAKATHPLVSDGAAATRNPDYRTIGRWPSPIDPLPDPPPDAARLSFGASDLATVRGVVGDGASAAGMDPDRSCDLVLAVSEIATNSVMHAGGSGELRLWSSSGRLFCEIRDPGLIEDPLTGRVQPEPTAPGGRGLWLANQLCDLVQIRTGERGTTVRVVAQLDS